MRRLSASIPLLSTALLVCCAAPRPDSGQGTAGGASQHVAPSDAALAHWDARPEADRIIRAARADEQGWARLTALCDRIGHRFAGSPGLEQAIDWAVQEFSQDGLDAVGREPVLVKHWKRGAESLELLEPGPPRPIAMLGLGNSPGTGARDITAPVVVVRDFDHLTALGEAVRGKIVLFDHPMQTKPNMFEAYGEAVQYRWRGPLEASRAGAVAALVRSVTTRSLSTPHTGSTKLIDPLEDHAQPIPAAAISIEAAETLRRLTGAGLTPVVRLRMNHQRLPDAPSANVVAELRGRERPDEVVVIGGHLDSWDVGQGAHDDGAGVVMSMQVLSLLKRLELRPRRSIRAVLFTNEECGLDGGRGYAERHASELDRHVAAMEADSGGFRPQSFSLRAGDGGIDRVRPWIELFSPLGTLQLVPSEGSPGADISPLVAEGVPGLGLGVDSTHYFDYHHTEADTLDKVDPTEFKDSVAAFTLMAWLLAEAPEPLPRQAPEPKGEKAR